MSLWRDGLALVAAVAAIGAGAWYWSTRPDGPPPSTSALAPYRLPMAAGGPTADQEIDFYAKRAARNPEGFMDNVSLGQAYLRKARATGEPAYFLQAELAARRSLAKFDKDNMGANVILLHVMTARHAFKEALAFARTLDTRDPDHPRASLVPSYITILLALGRPAEAAAYAKLLSEGQPDTASFTQYALVRYAQGRDAEALALFAKAIDREQTGQRETSALARAWLARLHLKRGRLDDAADLLQEADRILPGNPVVLTLRGDLALRRGKSADAELLYQQAYTAGQGAALVGAQARARELGGDVAGAAKLREQAIASLRRDLAANDFGHRRDLVRLLLESRSAAADREAATLMQEELTHRADAETLDIDAWALGRVGRYDEALAALDRAWSTGYRDAVLEARAAWLWERKGQAGQAAHHRQQASSLDPGYMTDPGVFALMSSKP